MRVTDERIFVSQEVLDFVERLKPIPLSEKLIQILTELKRIGPENGHIEIRNDDRWLAHYDGAYLKTDFEPKFERWFEEQFMSKWWDGIVVGRQGEHWIVRTADMRL